MLQKNQRFGHTYTDVGDDLFIWLFLKIKKKLETYG